MRLIDHFKMLMFLEFIAFIDCLGIWLWFKFTGDPGHYTVYLAVFLIVALLYPVSIGLVYLANWWLNID